MLSHECNYKGRTRTLKTLDLRENTQGRIILEVWLKKMMDDGEVHWVAHFSLQENNLGREVGKLRLEADTQGE